MPTKEFPCVTDCRVLINGEWIQLDLLKEVEIITPSDFKSDGGYNDFMHCMPSWTFPISWGDTAYCQLRTHRSKRVNKKWAKRYGYKL